MRNSLCFNGFWILAVAVPALVAPGLAAQPVRAQATPPPKAGQKQVAQITAVRLKPTPNGLEVLLETTGGASTLVRALPSQQGFVAEIANAQLRLPQSKAFRQDNPTPQITSVTVTPLEGNRIQVVVTGKAGVPTGQVFLRKGRGLVVRLTTTPAPPKQPTPTPTPAPQTTPKPGAEGPKPQTQEEEPIELVVTAERGAEEGYRVPNATTATKTDTPLRDIPQSIQVVPQEVLRDQQVNTTTEALRNVTGVTQFSASSNITTPEFTIRGFTLSDFSGNVLRNGLRSPLANYALNQFANIERVEVLKGPGSVLFGQGAPGGIINLVTKLTDI